MGVGEQARFHRTRVSAEEEVNLRGFTVRSAFLHIGVQKSLTYMYVYVH